MIAIEILEYSISRLFTLDRSGERSQPLRSFLLFPSGDKVPPESTCLRYVEIRKSRSDASNAASPLNGWDYLVALLSPSIVDLRCDC